MNTKRSLYLGLLVVALILAACGPEATPEPTATPLPPTATATTPVPMATPEPPTSTPEPATPTPEPPTATPEPPTPTPEPSTSTPEPPTATPEPPTPTPEPPTPTPEPPTSTPVPPTPTPEPPTPTAMPEPTRIRFEPGTTSATVTGSIEQNDIEHYVLRALAGQTMEVVITSLRNDVLLEVWGADGTVLKRHAVGQPYWRGELPSTQDYFINGVSVGGETDYTLTVIIRARIQFEPGATSATVTGSITQNDVEHYVLRALAGQTMEVIITSPNNDVLLDVLGADGTVLKRHPVGEPYWRGELPATQDYFINAVSVGGETSYTLTVTISALEPEPTCIQFEPGATSAVIEGILEQPGASDLYVLRALHGQRMVVHVSSPEWAVAISVEGEAGSFWTVPFVEGTLMIEELPATQDYVISLTTAATAGTTNYTMEVIITTP
jgi:hypothetical protein